MPPPRLLRRDYCDQDVLRSHLHVTSAVCWVLRPGNQCSQNQIAIIVVTDSADAQRPITFTAIM